MLQQMEPERLLRRLNRMRQVAYVQQVGAYRTAELIVPEKGLAHSIIY